MQATSMQSRGAKSWKPGLPMSEGTCFPRASSVRPYAATMHWLVFSAEENHRNQHALAGPFCSFLHWAVAAACSAARCR